MKIVLICRESGIFVLTIHKRTVNKQTEKQEKVFVSGTDHAGMKTFVISFHEF